MFMGMQVSEVPQWKIVDIASIWKKQNPSVFAWASTALSEIGA